MNRKQVEADRASASQTCESPAETFHKEFRQEVRLQTSLLTPLERRCLAWLAARLPERVNSDHLTLLGFLSTLGAAACYAVSRLWAPAIILSCVFIAMNWFGDSLDGTVARARNKQRPRYGYYVDHVIDALGILAIVCGLAAGGLMTWTFALAFLVLLYLLFIDVYLATHALGIFRMSFFKLGPTELRVLLAIGSLRAMLKPTVRLFGQSYLLFDVAVVVAMVVISIMVIASVLRNTVALYRAERI
ncbi:MAG TPA: CDP-alcohol phosphatidyltransferase family protein [Blastocatellia bacterium]|nr:CDP-alcohol phosphatidyltransferase family protein [Blastocatellia bacterium]